MTVVKPTRVSVFSELRKLEKQVAEKRKRLQHDLAVEISVIIAEKTGRYFFPRNAADDAGYSDPMFTKIWVAVHKTYCQVSIGHIDIELQYAPVKVSIHCSGSATGDDRDFAKQIHPILKTYWVEANKVGAAELAQDSKFKGHVDNLKDLGLAIGGGEK